MSAAAGPSSVSAPPGRLGRVARWPVAAARWMCVGDWWLGAAMLALVVYYFATRGVFQGKASGDGFFGFEYLRAIVFHHTLDMKTVVPQYAPFFGTMGPGQHMPNRCPFGPVLVWMPFYLIGCVVEWLHVLGHPTVVGHPKLLFTGDAEINMYVTAVGTLVGVLFGWRQTYVLLARHLSRGAARLGAIAAVWATPIAWYAVTQPCYQHGLAFAAVAILIERWDATRGDPSWQRMALLGVIGGLAMTMREQEALWLLLPGVEAAWHVARGPERGRWLVGGVVLCAAAFVAFLPQLLVWRYYTGSMFQPAQVEPLRWGTPFFVIALFSTRGGLLPWSPIVYATILGLVLGKKARGLAAALTAVFVLELYVIACAWMPTAGYSFGARRLSDGALLFGLGVGLLWDRLGERRWATRALAAFTALCIVLNVWAMELVRHGTVASSGGNARSAERFLTAAHAPPAVARLFGVIGYPFVQPMGWLFAAYWHAPASAFEDLVGNWFLDRDGQWLRVQTGGVDLNRAASGFVLHGLALGSDPPARVTGPARFLLPMFAREPIVVHLRGQLRDGAQSARWNGHDVVLAPEPNGLRFEVPAVNVRAGMNELLLDVPAGSLLKRIDFESTTQWWR